MKLAAEILELTIRDWRQSQNLALKFMRGLDCYGVDNPVERLAITTDCGANVRGSVELRNYGIGENARTIRFIWWSALV